MTLHYIETHIDEPEPAEKPTDEPEMPVETYEVEEWG